tara:strand:- start:152 stop:448 length:297 start_codon:yes stop_codon:yes gene_type:complete
VTKSVSLLTKKQWAAEMVQVIATGSLVSAVACGGLCSLIGLGVGLAEGFVTRAVGMAILSGLGGWLIGFLGGVLVVGTCVKMEGRKIEFREEDAMDRE